ncbi:Sterol 3-beta-glucosyltransferase [Handroanthus impetiginosus]|uniref:Sterol 3-beta-glucosyltransferase n=1 Tax=Handroanthus impetiginosus TaxID=429701 RepID=A0A2G9H5V1_9LAMI|nr:Sterol 3-beta-glucosyltransferase [Handroanthus impetiginosus]
MASPSLAAEAMRTKPIAVFMAFGTKGDVYPISALAAAFACDQRQYEVAFVTHAAHENLKGHLGSKGVAYFPISSPPALSSQQHNDTGGSTEVSFSLQKKEMTRKHRQECLSVIERIYGEGPVLDGDLIIINFFALEGWSLAELFHVWCVVAAPYVVPYSAPSTFERQFRNELPLLYRYLREAPTGKIGWEDVVHWMWPLFTEDWGTWRSHDLQLSFWPFTDPVTGLPTWHERPSSPLLLYGFSQEVVECPGYWPSAVRVCGFWFPPVDWQFSCATCAEMSSLISLRKLNAEDELCSGHSMLKCFLEYSAEPPIFISLSSVGSMGFLGNPQAFLRVLGNVLDITTHRFILLSAGYGPLDTAIKMLAQTPSAASEQMQSGEIQSCLFDGRLFCFSGAVPYDWLFPRCAAAIHHGGSGSTAAALRAGIPQIICPFILDQFYWAERMFWLGVAPQPLNRNCLVPDKDEDSCILEAANVLVRAINYALSPKVKLHATQIANRISTEDGVSTALQIIKEEIICTDTKS